MKTIFSICTLLIFQSILYSQSFNVEIIQGDSSPHLLGKINKEALTSSPYASWFTTQFDQYEVDKNIIDQLKNELSNYTITAFMGTWCGDSKREVPRFYKILTECNFPLERLTMIAVGRNKQSNGGEEEGLKIHRVPTFIVYKNGKEVNRIVERPVNTLEEDLLNTIENKYTPNYEAVFMVDKNLSLFGIEKFTKKQKKVLREIQPISKSEYELNTYAHVLFKAKKYEEAVAVAQLNRQLYPDKITVYKTLAGFLRDLGQRNEALSVYKDAMQIDPNNASLIELVSQLQTDTK